MSNNNHNHKKFSNDHLNKLREQHDKKIKLLISLSVIGLVLFSIGSAALPFKDKKLDTFYPKKQSKAEETPPPLASRVSTIRYGFYPWNISYEQAFARLGSPNSYSYNLNSPSHIYIIGKGSQMWSDPSNLKLLTDTNLENMSFSNDAGGISPPGWILSSSGPQIGTAVIEEDKKVETTNQADGSKVLINRGTPEGDNKVVKVTNNVVGGYTQIAQKFKRTVVPGQWVVFGAWVKADDFPSVRVFLQNPADSQPFPNPVMTSYGNDVVARRSSFEDPVIPSNINIDNERKRYFPFKWTFVMGYVQVPAGVNSAQLVLRVGNGRAWFDGAAAAIIDSGAVTNETIRTKVNSQPGSAWFIGNEPGAEEDCFVSKPSQENPLGTSYSVADVANIRHTPADIYALIYHQFYKLIKKYDSTALVTPGGFAGASVPWDAVGAGFVWTTDCDGTQYNPKQYLNDFRTAYKTKFKLSGENVEPPVDGIGIHYYESDPKAIDAGNFRTYMQNLRTYMDGGIYPDGKTLSNGVAGWQGKPIWLTEFGTRRENLTDASGVDHSVEFAQNALKFLKTNSLKIEKWFWFETCGNAGVSPLFEMQSPGVCQKYKTDLKVGTTIIKAGTTTGALSPLGLVWASQDKEGSINWAIRWTIQAEPVCQTAGKIPAIQTIMTYAVWPSYPLSSQLTWKNDAPATGTHSQVIAATVLKPTDRQNIYVGLKTAQGQTLKPVGDPPHPAITYGEAFNPLTPLAQWSWSALSIEQANGVYKIQFQVPDAFCTAPTSISNTSNIIKIDSSIQVQDKAQIN